jgi:hypothetical protein
MELIQILNELRQKLIELNPEYEKRDIFIFPGIDIAIRFFKMNGYWEAKIADCSRCGSCCKMMTGKSFPFATSEGCKYLGLSGSEGCKYLGLSGNEHLCMLSYFRPNGCAVAELDLEECTVEWESIK